MQIEETMTDTRITDDPFNMFGLIVHPKTEGQNNANGNNFSSIIETLERIGKVNRHRNTITQLVHIKVVDTDDGPRYGIFHYRELYALDAGKPVSSVSMEDIRERNYVANILHQWDMITIDDEDKIAMIDEGLYGGAITILPHAVKRDYELVQHYSFSEARKRKNV